MNSSYINYGVYRINPFRLVPQAVLLLLLQPADPDQLKLDLARMILKADEAGRSQVGGEHRLHIQACR